ncbi:hypothetical protein BS17DRAFT_780505 [Gyrodon lividus]|nr:hypothetical protein BS17DRAFT_780505 [Gyrodon lividus]
MSLEIAPTTNPGPLPKTTPSLMPFHISYSGPAPISRYFSPKPAPPSSLSASTHASSSATLVGSPTTAGETQNNICSLGSVVSEATSATVVNFLDAHNHGEPSSNPATVFVQKAEVSKEVTITLFSPVSTPANGDNATMDVDAETQPVSLNDSVSLPIPRPASSNLERLVAAFRGRQMYGQAVGLPEGYGGLVLQAPSLDAKGQGKEDARASSKPPFKSTKAKSKSKSTRATRQSTRGGNMEEDDDEGSHMDGEGGDCVSPPPDPSAPIRKLIPASTFSSFTLWTPDRPVDEGRDEYMRALAEWTRLAAEIHSCDE